MRLRTTALAVLLCAGLAGCAAPAQSEPSSAPLSSPSAAAAGSQLSLTNDQIHALNVASPFTVIETGKTLPDSSQYAGKIATLNSIGAVAFDAPNGKAVALVSNEYPLPVFDTQAGWVLVMLPSRAHWPSEHDGAVNGSVAWIRADGVNLKDAPKHLEINLNTSAVSVVDTASTVTTHLPIAHSGLEAPAGWTFVLRTDEKPGTCQTASPITLAAQSNRTNGWSGDGTTPSEIEDLAVTAPSCDKPVEYGKDRSPAAIGVHPLVLQNLRPDVVQGMPVKIIGGASSPAAPSTWHEDANWGGRNT